MNQSMKNGNLFACCLACVCMCFLDCLKRLIQIVNDYALVYVAIYGNKFWTSGKMVFKLMKSTRLEPLFNDWALRMFSFIAILTSMVLCVGLLGGISALVFKDM